MVWFIVRVGGGSWFGRHKKLAFAFGRQCLLGIGSSPKVFKPGPW